MKIYVALLLLLLSSAIVSCDQGNSASKIPQISLLGFIPDSVMRVNVDTCAIYFALADGDGDLANDAVSGIYLKDSRYEADGFIRSPFPDIDPAIEDPKKGLEGTCIFVPIP